MSRIDSSNPYRVQGPVTSIAELAKNKPGFVVPATAAQIDELQSHQAQSEAREAAGARQTAQNADPIYAQVVLDGEVVATVYASGIAATQQTIPGLKLTEDGQGKALAKTRLDEIMKAIPGAAIYDNFVRPASAPSSAIAEAAPPTVTARGLNDMVRDLDWDLARSRMTLDDALKK
jgi:hypothetical protein